MKPSDSMHVPSKGRNAIAFRREKGSILSQLVADGIGHRKIAYLGTIDGLEPISVHKANDRSLRMRERVDTLRGP